jgi:hypothetical protein
MRVEERLRQAYERTRSSGPAQAGAYDRFLRQRARSVRTVVGVVAHLDGVQGSTRSQRSRSLLTAGP